MTQLFRLPKQYYYDAWFAHTYMRFSNSNVQPTSFDCNGCVIGLRTQSDRTADAI